MNLGATELLIIAGVLVLLFGATKLPKLARSLGESARIFKSETKGLRKDEDNDAADGEQSDKAEQAASGKAESKQLPKASAQEPLDAETVDEQPRNHKAAS